MSLVAAGKKLPLTNNVVLDQATVLELIDQLVLEDGAAPSALAAERAVAIRPHAWLADLLEGRGSAV